MHFHGRAYVKFKGRNIMKQYMKVKPTGLGFKLWYRCDVQSGCLLKTDIYTGKKEQKGVGVGEFVVLDGAAGLETSNFISTTSSILYKLMNNDKISTSDSQLISIEHLEFRTQLTVALTLTPQKFHTRSRIVTTANLGGHYQERLGAEDGKRRVVCTKNGFENGTNTICF